MDFIVPTGEYFGYRYEYGSAESGVMNQFVTYYSGTYLLMTYAYDTPNVTPEYQSIQSWISYVVNTGDLASITGNPIGFMNYEFPGYYNIGLTNSQSGIYSMVWGSGNSTLDNVEPPQNDPGGSEE